MSLNKPLTKMVLVLNNTRRLIYHVDNVAFEFVHTFQMFPACFIHFSLLDGK